MGANAGEDTPIAGRSVRWISDPEIRPGGCLVESRERLVDGRVDTALERIYRTIIEDDA
jgi:flagellar biosynthesis/type III secretory pathway protein FliH